MVLAQALKPEGAEEDLGGDAEAVAQAGGHGEGQGLREGGADVGGAEHDGKFVALLVDVCGTAAEVKAVAGGRARELTVEATALHAQMPAGVAAVVERAWWPAKVIDSESPSCLLPIKPRWSTELFNVPAMLLPRSHVLGISREHVYYRSSGRRGESVPARLLWCVSGGGTHMDGRMVVGSSRLDEVLIDAPDALFPKFEHLGAYGRAEVREAADASGRAMALRFSDTEIFPKPVTLGWVAQSDARRPWRWPLDPDLGPVEGPQPSNWTNNNKPQADDLGFHYGAGDENRTRALSLGSDGACAAIGQLNWADSLSGGRCEGLVAPLLTVFVRSEGHAMGTTQGWGRSGPPVGCQRPGVAVARIKHPAAS
ncbi:hypothetical protein SGFS_063950 [Streptomyces graminofaciens]|uniref:Uncharacterized protein n=1 Tax=Streptomyces graminofaciens TaxID=68212 RepID=A0ABN5VSN9_9ACTN|nr:hypothetical protein [Streptomyces graminofaciens]BBC35101.1 hypothetical protein SGFS_063950 [Streptomyces graminofaciens]